MKSDSYYCFQKSLTVLEKLLYEKQRSCCMRKKSALTVQKSPVPRFFGFGDCLGMFLVEERVIKVPFQILFPNYGKNLGLGDYLDIVNQCEFNFQTEKILHNNLPIDLFNKLSLVSETQVVGNPMSKVPQSISTPAKGSKENRWGCFQQGNEIKQHSKVNLFGVRQQVSADEENNEVNTALGR